MICEGCGSEIREGAVFCTECGKKPEVKADEIPSAEMQAPCVSAIPEPPQMPDLPEPPQIIIPQAYQPPQQQYQPPQQQYQPPPQAYQPPPQQYQPPPQAYQPPQQQYQPPPQQYHPPQQYYQPQQQYLHGPGVPKKSKTGLIIGIAAGSVGLITLIVFIGLFIGNRFSEGAANLENLLNEIENTVTDHSSGLLATPAPVPPSPPVIPDLDPWERPNYVMKDMSEYDIEGMWELEDGDWIWFFGQSEFIYFIDNYDGTFDVYAYEPDEYGRCFFTEDGYMIVEFGWNDLEEFTWFYMEDYLVIRDRDGDSLFYVKADY